MGIVGLRFNFFNVAGIALIFGFGVDYGIYLVQAHLEEGVSGGFQRRAFRWGKHCALCGHDPCELRKPYHHPLPRPRLHRGGPVPRRRVLSGLHDPPLAGTCDNQLESGKRVVKWDAVVIGSGIGGLACAGMLAAKGAKVVVLEQAATPGGYLTSFRRGGFTFDTAVDCIAGLDPDGLLTWLLRALGVDGRLTPIRLDPIRVSRFPGVTIQVDASLPAYIDRLSCRFPSERHGIAAFFRRAGEIYDAVDAMMNSRSKRGKRAPMRFPRRCCVTAT